MHAPMQVPNTIEWRVNFGTQCLHIGQCIVLNIFGILHYWHFKLGVYKYGLISNAFFPLYWLERVETVPLPLKPTRAYITIGAMIIPL